MIPVALTIAGADSGGGAGIQADLKSFASFGVYGTSVITAVTAQNTVSDTAVEEIGSSTISAQIRAVLEDFPVRAIKIGMLGSPATIRAVARELNGFGNPVVLDPVMVAKSGDVLLREDAVAALVEELVPIASIVTPNLPEAARLLGERPVDSLEDMKKQGVTLLGMGPGAVLMKGGHASGDACHDVLVTQEDEPLVLTSRRVCTRHTHGTGCTLSSAIAAGLARGQTLAAAVGAAHAYLQYAIGQADDLDLGSGHGPVHHYYWTSGHAS